ncbi:MAG: hypothetical protein J5808_06065 [Paludibacteraceae bacterium]|nr:hypothetical protein [Paludibacteraceae bacterium]
MNSRDFWADIQKIVENGFTPEGLAKLDAYAEKFFTQQLVYKRFSSSEQHGCADGGTANVIASILAGADVAANSGISTALDFKAERQRAAAQELVIEQWARKVGCWYANAEQTLCRVLGQQIAEGGEAHVFQHGCNLIKAIGLDYYIQPILALDRISLHNTYFPETRLTVLGFGRFSNGEFKIIVEQSHIQGSQMTDEEIAIFAQKMGFELINPGNWTFATPEIYLSDLHDENVIRSNEGNIFVVDCDIRINTPELRCKGIRKLSVEVSLM